MRSLDDVIGFYNGYNERDRLAGGTGLLELTRSQEIIARHIPKPPACVADIGGAAGVYSCWLARKGYQVTLIDLAQKHVEQALEASAQQSGFPLANAFQGDARDLPLADQSQDVVLLMGPLYHLTERVERLTALREAYRILREGGVILAAAISRYASLLDGLRFGLIDDPEFMRIMDRDLLDGQHRNPENKKSYFTTSFFHTPQELADELAEAGFTSVRIMSVEGPGELACDFTNRWNDQQKRENLLAIIRRLEEDPTLVAISPHMMGVGRK